MKTIPLSQGRFALVDDEDFEWLSEWKWYAKRVRFKTHDLWYAARVDGHRGPTISMHREIMIRLGHSTEKHFDHKDGNGLNNQRGNLRPCVGGQNHWNRQKMPGKSSRFKGVTWNKKDRKWMASLMCKGKDYSLGYFANEDDAGRAYDAAAKVHFGEFARLNFP